MVKKFFEMKECWSVDSSEIFDGEIDDFNELLVNCDSSLNRYPIIC